MSDMTGEGDRLPGIDRGPPDQIVLHADMDCFYAACEQLREPALRGEPVVVGMGYEPDATGGAVATASYEARAYGVESAQRISEALERLPRKVDAATNPDLDVDAAGFYRPVDMEYYRSVSREVRAILDSVADTVRIVSIDEAYLDITTRTEWDTAEAFGRELKARIASEVGIVASLGIAPTMTTAKIASDFDKPDGLYIVPPDDVRSFLTPLDIELLHGVGPKTAGQLRGEGIETIGDLASADRGWILDEFGERGEQLFRRARGEDHRSVTPRGRPKSLSRESAVGSATTDTTLLESRLEALAESVAERAMNKGAFYRTIGIKVVTPPFEVTTRERSLPGPVSDANLVQEVARSLFEEFHGERVRKIGVRVSNLTFDSAEQSDLVDWATESGVADETDPHRMRAGGGQSSLGDFTK